MPSIAPRLPFLLRPTGTAPAERGTDQPPANRKNEGSAIVLRPGTVTAAIWVLVASIFLLDLLTPADDVSVCFAYLIPVFVSLFESRPRPILYASAASVLSILGMVVQPPSYATTVMMVLIAVLTQWVVAILVRLQQRRLVEANDKAESQRRFVDILSHEVGTALTTVTGQAYRLTKLSEQLAPDDLRLRAEKIRKAAERIQVIISRIQFASSLGDGSIPTGEGAVNLHAMMEQLADQMEEEEQQGGRIELKLSRDPKHVAGDEMLLRQIFENVITNGIKYSPSNSPVTVSVSEHGSAVRVIIADQGSGIAQDELARVRHAYYRGPNSKGTSGAGLGLYVVEKLVEAHHGRLSIESEIGCGTKVTIDLPLISFTAAA
jgi:signal transduction histidine kinase